MGAIIAVVDVATLSGSVIMILTDDRRITVIPITVFNTNTDVIVITKIWSIETVCRIGGLISLDKPIRVMDNPL